MPLYNPSFIASGNIRPARFVRISGEFTVAECGANANIIGVCQEGTFAPPNLANLLGGTDSGLAASAGQTLKVFGLGDVCVVLAGGTIVAGDKVKSHTDGSALTIGTVAGTFNVGGTALQDVLAGEKCLIQVNPHSVVVE